MHTAQSNPASSEWRDRGGNVVIRRVPSDNVVFLRITETLHDGAFLEEDPTVALHLAVPGTRVEPPVDLHDGVSVIVYLSSVLFALRVNVEVIRKEAKTRRVPCYVSAQAETHISASVADKSSNVSRMFS
jgi:hypothetical protein